MFESGDNSKGLEGKPGGMMQVSGAYAWICHYRFEGEPEKKAERDGRVDKLITVFIQFFNPIYDYPLHYIHKNFIFVEQDMDQIKLYNILRTDMHLADDKAADFVSAMSKVTERELAIKIQTLATKDDIRDDFQDLYKSIFLYGLVQLIAIIASVLAIVKFLK